MTEFLPWLAQALFWLAVACSIIAAASGNRTAWALLASVGLCLGFSYMGVPFNFILWLLIDLVVVLVIIRPEMTVADCFILALFIPAWVAYLLPDSARFQLSFVVVVAQMLLTFPTGPATRAVAGLFKPKDKDPPNMMVAHA